MKDVSITLIGALFVLISLLSLILADPTPIMRNAPLAMTEQHASEMGIRYALHR